MKNVAKVTAKTKLTNTTQNETHLLWAVTKGILKQAMQTQTSNY
jgi:hypothetical protein